MTDEQPAVYYNPDGTVWEPAFTGQRPPFQKGNQYAYAKGNALAVTHGAYSAARTDPIARGFIEEIASTPDVAYLAAPQYAAALWSWARTAARVQLLEQWIDTMTIEQATNSARGQVSPLELLRKWTATLNTQQARLGLDPLSFVRLGKDVATARQADAATLLTQRRTEAERAARADDNNTTD